MSEDPGGDSGTVRPVTLLGWSPEEVTSTQGIFRDAL